MKTNYLDERAKTSILLTRIEELKSELSNTKIEVEKWTESCKGFKLLLNKQTASNVKFGIGYNHTIPPIDYAPQAPLNKDTNVECISENGTKLSSEQSDECCVSKTCDSDDGVSESVDGGSDEINDELTILKGNKTVKSKTFKIKTQTTTNLTTGSLVEKECVAPLSKLTPEVTSKKRSEDVSSKGKNVKGKKVTHYKAGHGLIKINGVPINLVQPEILRYKAFEPFLLIRSHKVCRRRYEDLSQRRRSYFSDLRYSSEYFEGACCILPETF